ncbi:MAG TPA: c-type cytochrome [Trueperaceae bacterium]
MFRLACLGFAVAVLGFVSGFAQEGGPPPAPEGPPPVLMLQGDVENGERLVGEVCSGCHGVDGISTTPAFPRIGGQIQEYLAIQAWLFKEGIRPSPVMGPVATALSDQEIADAAAYLATVSTTGEPFAAQDQAPVERGATLFHMGNVEAGLVACAVCHGRNGEGVEATGIPQIAGQSPSYLVSMLNTFAMVPDFGDAYPNAMHIVASTLSEEDMNAVAAFLGSQPWNAQP